MSLDLYWLQCFSFLVSGSQMCSITLSPMSSLLRCQWTEAVMHRCTGGPLSPETGLQPRSWPPTLLCKGFECAAGCVFKCRVSAWETGVLASISRTGRFRPRARSWSIILNGAACIYFFIHWGHLQWFYWTSFQHFTSNTLRFYLGTISPN